MMMIESAMAVGSHTATTNFGCSSSSSFVITSYRPWWISDDPTGVHFSSRRPAFAPRLIDSCSFRSRASFLKSRIRAASEFSSSESDPPRQLNGKQNYHPYEEIGDSVSEINKVASLSAAETARTLIEVNSKATLMFTGLINDLVHENVFWPDLPYLTDEHGNIYFEMNNDEDILQSLSTENNFVQVIIGLDTTEMLSEMELGSADIDFGIEEIADEDSDEDAEEDDDDGDDGYEEEWISILDDEDNEVDSDETLGDWAKLETMRSSHPMYFAKKMAEVTSDDPMDWMDQTSAGIAIQGLLRPAFIEEQSVIRKHISSHQSTNDDTNQVGTVEVNLEGLGINGHEHKSDFGASSKDGSISAEEFEKDENLRNGTSFYKLEMVKIHLVSAHGNQTDVEVQDFQKAHPDSIAHSADKIISRLKAGGEKTAQALKSLCWIIKGLQVEEARLIGVDSLGFDLRVCSGTQVQTLRFAFNTRATSEYSAERQLRDLMFPRIHHKPQKWEEAHQKEC